MSNFDDEMRRLAGRQGAADEAAISAEKEQRDHDLTERTLCAEIERWLPQELDRYSQALPQYLQVQNSPDIRPGELEWLTKWTERRHPVQLFDRPGRVWST
jgi:hypothetical protein